MLGGCFVNMCREGRISPEKEFNVVSVAVWMGGRVSGELLRDRQCDDGVRPGHRARHRNSFDGQREEVKTVMGETKRADEVRGVRWIRGKSIVGERLKRIKGGQSERA